MVPGADGLDVPCGLLEGPSILDHKEGCHDGQTVEGRRTLALAMDNKGLLASSFDALLDELRHR